MDALCRNFRDRYEIAAITNDIYTKEDAEFSHPRGVTAVRTHHGGWRPADALNTAHSRGRLAQLGAIAEMQHRFPDLDVVLIESGGDNLAATYSPELADLTIYVIDVSAGDKIPRKGGPGITRSDLLVINKTDLAPHVGANLDIMDRDARKMRGERPFVLPAFDRPGADHVARFIETAGGLIGKGPRT